ncbi:MAG: glycoside hydrolase family 18 protein [Cytophagaceae bacterium]
MTMILKHFFRITASILTILFTFHLAIVIAQPGKEMKTDTLKPVQVVAKQKEIVGYYPNWRLYNRQGMVKPENIDFSKYTIINYSFFKPNEKGEILSSDPITDKVLLEQSPTIVELAHIKGTKVVVSVGGWTFSDQFPGIAADPVKRAKFGQECVRLLRQYNLDGIDIDWEHPGYEGHNGTPQDKQNFTLLMQAIRDSIDAYGRKINYRFLLTGAFGTYDDVMNMIEWDKVVPIMDFIHMMTYDFNGPWSSDANHNSPLFPPKSGLPNSVDWVFKRMTEKHNVPLEKLTMGMAFYGRSVLFPKKDAEIYKENTKLVDTITWPLFEGTPQYYSILADMNKFDKYWDDAAQVPYLIKKDKTCFLSYDDEKSIRLKAEHIMQNNLAGVIIWEITGDYLETSPGSAIVGKTPLIDTVNEVFKTNRKRQKIKRPTEKVK